MAEREDQTELRPEVIDLSDICCVRSCDLLAVAVEYSGRWSGARFEPGRRYTFYPLCVQHFESFTPELS